MTVKLKNEISSGFTLLILIKCEIRRFWFFDKVD